MQDIQHQQVVQEAVKPKFHGHDTLECKTKPCFPASAEREFRRVTNAYMRILHDIIKDNVPQMMAAYKRERRGDSRFDDIRDLESEIRQLFMKMAAQLEERLSSFRLDTSVEKIAKMTKNTSIREWKRAVKKTLGIDLLDDYYKGDFYKDAIDRWVGDNVLKIKSIPTEALGEMQHIIIEGYRSGRTIRDIQKAIQEAYDVSKRKAQLLSRDQVATLNAQITKLQHQDAGVTRYKWSTSRDSRVRECHRALEGKIISWDDPPEMWYSTKSKGIVHTSRRCHPGEDICCRCVAIPVFDFQKLDPPMKGKTEA